MTSISKIAFIANEAATARMMVKEVERYFGNLVQVSEYSIEAGLPPRINCDIAVVTTETVLSMARNALSSSAKVIRARRTVSYRNIQRLLRIPAGSKVTVASKDLSSVEETISILQRLGISHVEYSPWIPGLPTPDSEVVLVSGGPHLAPPGAKVIIDIGFRPIDISTVADIVFACGLPTEIINAMSLEYISAVIGANRELLDINSKLEEANAQLKTLISSLDEGVVYVDKNYAVELWNQAALELLGFASGIFQRQNLTSIIGEEPLSSVFKQGVSMHDVKTLHSKQISFSIVPIFREDEIYGAVCVLRDVSDVRRLESEIAKTIEADRSTRYSIEDIYGKSSNTKQLREKIRRFASTDFSILVTGESGVGKEVAAQAIHKLSPRASGPFVAVNFAALPESLADSELFGYEEGAFTGARRGGHRGYFESAHKGTIFLDEIGDASPSVQASLLRVLQEKAIVRVGGNKVIPLDFRVIAASNRPLRKMVQENKFRNDLYYRLSVLNLSIPPLRERRDDIPELLRQFFLAFGEVPEMEDNVVDFLCKYDWPGNIRELQNVVAHIATVYDGAKVKLSDLPEDIFYKEVFSENEQDYLTLLQKLEQDGNLHLFYEILEALSKSDSPYGVSKADVALSCPSNPPLHTVREYLERLEAVGACIIGPTKRGTRVTAKGINLLSYIKNYLALLNTPNS